MRIKTLVIQNFRAIREMELTAPSGGVVIAGPNGCGKSSVFDAIRLLKSAYGQYNPNEWQLWFSEFQISLQRIATDARRVLFDASKPFRIRCEIELSQSERDYLSLNGTELLTETNWQSQVPDRTGMMRPGRFVAPADRRTHGVAVEQAVTKQVAALQRELQQDAFVGQVTMDPMGQIGITDSAVLELIFSVYRPPHVGLIDYHSPHRIFNREEVGSVNLNVATSDTRSRDHSLYNTQQKYTNVKAEMASAYVREALAERAGVPPSQTGNLIKTLQELFEVFFPGKTFVGPTPTADGALLFPVRLENGKEHDIDELSSGEKEVLLGYLRLRKSAPSNSVILLDEPELHLNPRLIRGLPRFYQKHLGEALNTQIWMITHSDTLLRQAVEDPSYAVFHMQSALSSNAGESQVHPISARKEVERAVMDLVGDLASYSPRSKTVLVEGGGESDTDVRIISDLFPDFPERVNLLSAGNKRAVEQLHKFLERADADRLGFDFYSIVDRDFDGPRGVPSGHRYQWDVYHVENYLLDTSTIREVMRNLDGRKALSDPEIDSLLKACAAETIPGLVKEKLEQYTHDALWEVIKIGADPTSEELGRDYRAAAERCVPKLQKALDDKLQTELLEALEQEHRDHLSTALVSGAWRSEFRGRDILSRFTSKAGVRIPYESFRNLIIAQMRQTGVKPVGMASVLNAILSA